LAYFVVVAGVFGMNHLQMIHEFLREKRSLRDVADSGFPFVTISRQAAAGGHLFSYVLLTDFLKYQDSELFRGWHVFDKQLCEVIAQDPELRDSMETLLAEQYHSEWRDFMDSLFVGRSKQQALNAMTAKVIRMLATLGKVIIVGRGACWITRDMAKGVHIRLVAPQPQRILWMMKRFKLTKEKARASVMQQDADRRKLAKSFFNKDIGDPLEYDAVWNTASVEMHDISEAVINMVRRRAAKSMPG
jgi:cytidylate kinase